MFMKKFIMRAVALSALCAAWLPLIAEDCIMHIRTSEGKTVDIIVNELTQGAVYGNLPAYPASVFYASTGLVTTDDDGRPVPVVEDGVVKGSILCEIPVIGIDEITFTGLSAINEMRTDKLGVTVSEGIMRISRVSGPVHVTVADISGMTEYDRVITSDTEIDLNRYGKGIRVIAVDELTFKILVE